MGYIRGYRCLHQRPSKFSAMIELLLLIVWSARTCAIFSLTTSPVFTMEPLNATENEDHKQAFTVPLDIDLEKAVTDPVTDGHAQISSQTTAISTVTPDFDNVTDGVENITQLQTTTSIEPRQPISLDVFNMKITESSGPAVDSATKENGNNSNLVPVHDPNKAYPFDEQPGSYLEMPMENSTEGEECFSNMSKPTGQKGDKGDQGDAGSQGLEGVKGEKGLEGKEGSKGEMGAPGNKGEPGASCEKGDLGIFGNEGAMDLKGDKGIKGEPGEKGYMGTDGMPGAPGIVGPKGDRGLPGTIGPQGYRGPAGMPGRKGEKGQGSPVERDNIAFSVALRGNTNTLLPGQPLRFDKVFVNENKPYHVNSGVFVATLEGVYYFSYHLNPSISCLVAGLAHNGRIVAQTKMSKCKAFPASGSVLLHLTEDDEVWLQVIGGGRNELIFDESDSLFSGFMLYSLED